MSEPLPESNSVSEARGPEPMAAAHGAQLPRPEEPVRPADAVPSPWVEEKEGPGAENPRPDVPLAYAAPIGIPRGESASPVGWLDLLYLMIFYLGIGLLLILFVSGAAMLVLHIPYAVMQKSVGIQSSVLIVAQGLTWLATLAFLYLRVRERTRAPFWRALGWRPLAHRGPLAARYVLTGCVLALAVGILSRYVSATGPVPFEQMFRSRASIMLMTALGILVAPAAEETVFRGILYPLLASRFGISVGVLVTGTVFGLAHAAQLGFTWGLVALLIGVGIVLTYIRARAGTVTASFLVHVGYNTMIFAGLYLATGGLRHLPG